MIVVTITGILTVIAIPQYQNYTIRARVIEGFQLAVAAKLEMSKTYSANTGNDLTSCLAPCTNVASSFAYIFTPSKYFSGIGISKISDTPATNDGRINIKNLVAVRTNLTVFLAHRTGTTGSNPLAAGIPCLDLFSYQCFKW
jgi:type IV pilus assembly protein PilA